MKQYKKLMEYDDVDLEFTDDALGAIADKAIERNIGARGLRAVMEGLLTQIMYDIPSDKTVVKAVVTKDCVEGKAEPELTRAQRQVLQEKVEFYAQKWEPRMGVHASGWTLRKMKTRWGSCSSKGNLNFNCLLMLAPAEILDYVVVHELCHRKEMNHSKAFWAEVEKVLPDYRESVKWLKEKGIVR